MKKFYKHKIKPSKRLIHRGLKSLTRRYCAITILLLFNLYRYKSYSTHILSKMNKLANQFYSDLQRRPDVCTGHRINSFLHFSFEKNVQITNQSAIRLSMVQVLILDQNYCFIKTDLK